MSLHRELLIDGHFVGGPCDQSIGKSVIKNPYDGSIVGTAAEGGWSELNACLDAATDAFNTWRSSSRPVRQELLRSIAALVKEREDELVEILTDEVGKPVTWSKGEVMRLALTFEFAAETLDYWGTEEIRLDRDPRGKDYVGRSERFPIGVIFGIVPYNWPYNLAAHKLAPAIASGNTIVLKTSPLAPLSTLTLARLIHEAGCPPGVVNAWSGAAELAQRAALDDRVKMLSFTGSAAVGWKLRDLLPRKRAVLELGGNATAIVCADADLDWATQRIVAGKFGYAGQICISIQHVLAERSIYEDIRRRLIEATRACPTGNPRDPQIVCGPLISCEAADRVMAWIEEGISGGGTLLAGGSREGNLVQPTLIESVPKSSRLAREEVFGPVLTLEPFDTFDQAIESVNGSQYGIHCGVFTRDDARADQAFRSLEVGGVVIGDYPTLRFDNLPYGGVKQSGIGREGVRYAMDEMTEPKTRVAKKEPGP